MGAPGPHCPDADTVMKTAHCLQIAELLHEALRRELGEGIDSLRMVAEPLYARDVLLVCDALPGSELARLAQQYREAAAEVPPLRAASVAAPAPVRRWFAPSRWRGDR